MQSPASEDSDFLLARTSAEVVIRVGLLLLLTFWCFSIAQPFLVPIIWGMVIAVAVYRGYAKLRHLLGERAGLAATLVTLGLLLVLLVPLGMLSRALVDDVARIVGALDRGEVTVPLPPVWLAGLPIVGVPLDQFWRLADANLGQALANIEPQLRAAGVWLLSLVAGAGFGMLSFLAAIVISGVLLAHSAAAERLAEAVAVRLIGARGVDLVLLAEQTIRGVARGVLGTALIQSLLVGMGLVAAGIPGAAFLTLLSFLLSVIQIGPALVLLGAVAYKFSLGFTLGAFLFFAWCVLAGISDNFLRPILLSRGGDVPVWVILIGTLGGLIAHGLIGLFVGPIVVSLGYRLFQVWIAPVAGSGLEGHLGHR
ncbi:MAG: AI-2E family transporter [Geminicoccaceae bacterium]